MAVYVLVHYNVNFEFSKALARTCLVVFSVLARLSPTRQVYQLRK